jgi:hypothetical protein
MLEESPYHIMPESDFREHTFNDCWCKPLANEDGVIVHNSADGREFLENLILLKGEVHTHLAKVASLWFTDLVEEFLNNEENAFHWMRKRMTYLKTFKTGCDLKLTVFASYVENFIDYVD